MTILESWFQQLLGRNRALGIDISDTSIVYTQLAGKGKSARLKRFNRIPLSTGAIENGVIVDKEIVFLELQKIQKETKETDACVALPDTIGSFFKITFTKDPDAINIQELIEMKLKELVLFSFEEMILDYKITRETAYNTEVEVIVLPKTIGVVYQNILKATGFAHCTFRTSAQAAQKTVVLDGDADPHMVIVMGDNHATLSFVKDNQLVGSDHFSLNDSKLEDKMMHHHDTWNTTNGHKQPLKCITICGPQDKIESIERLSTMLRKKVEHADVWKNFDYKPNEVPPISFEESLLYAVALGLAKEGLEE